MTTPMPTNQSAPTMRGEEKMFRHRKRGTVYRVLGEAQLQASAPLPDEAALVVYQGEDGKLWARSPFEFYDGRFEEIEPTTPTPSVAAGALREAAMGDVSYRRGMQRGWAPAQAGAEAMYHRELDKLGEAVGVVVSTRTALAQERPAGGVEGYQKRVDAWIQACFGKEIGADKVERNHRFLEEALELVQAGGCTRSEAHQLVDYVFGRPVGALGQEVGGVMNTLAALCTAHGVDLDAEAERELARVWTKVEKIRAKQQAKPKHSPLPEHARPTPPASLDAEAVREACARLCDAAATEAGVQASDHSGKSIGDLGAKTFRMGAQAEARVLAKAIRALAIPSATEGRQEGEAS